MKNKKLSKILVLVFLVITLSGCTKVLKDKDKKAVKNTETGQNITENILCRPTEKKTIEIYEKNKVKIDKLPECTEMKAGGKYEDIWTNGFIKPLAWLIINLGKLFTKIGLNSGVYGLSLILITLAIRLLLFPVTRKTAMQSENIKIAQPELNRIEKKYENKQDQESQAKKGQEMMAIYKKHGINPLSGCIFAVIQLPLLFAFLEAINRIPAIFEGKFLFLKMGMTPWTALNNGEWLYIIIPILIIVTTYFSFKMNNSTASPEMEKQNKIMMYMMVGIISFTSFTLPTAVAIYWITSSVFTIAQNMFTDKGWLKNGKNKS